LVKIKGAKMILHHEFIRTAKKFPEKVAIIDKATGRDVPYARALIGALILKKRIARLNGNGKQNSPIRGK
jgi:hypothetical protein